MIENYPKMSHLTVLFPFRLSSYFCPIFGITMPKKAKIPQILLADFDEDIWHEN